MKVSMHAVSADLITNILGNLSWLLQKGEANATSRKFDPAVLLSARLAPDMLPLTRQIQIAGDIAKNSLARLAGQEPPRFEDNETTIEQLRARLARTIDYIKSIPASAFEGSEDPRHQGAGRRAHARVQGPGLPADLGDPERVLPRHDRLQHPASQRRGSGQG